MEEKFILEMHYGGHFIKNPHTNYMGGNVKYVEDCDPDLMSFFELRYIYEQLGFQPTSMIMYFRTPGVSLDNGLRRIWTDDEVTEMLGLYSGLPVISIYLEAGDEPSNGVEDINEDEASDDSSDPEWLNEGLEGDGDEDIFASHSENVEDKATERDQEKASYGQMEGDVEDWWSDPGNEIEMLSQLGSSDEEDLITYPEFNEDVDIKKPELKVGLKFTNAQVFREALKEWSVQNGYDIKYKRNENARITAVCKNECGWRIHASPMQCEKTFQIKSLNPVHKCGRSYDNHLVTSRYLTKKYLESFRDDPNLKVEAMQRTVKRDIMVNVNRSQVYRAKRQAKNIIEGDHNKQYAKLWDYCETVRKYNPGSCMKLMVERPSPEIMPRFERMYVTFAAQKEGFIAGCRPIVGLDGCHLKGFGSGQLLAAVGRDGNDNMFPLAIAVVEAETKSSWTWFLSELRDDIGRDQFQGWTFISDRQKGLVETFEELLPTADHRYCLRHMYSNFKQKFKGKELKDYMWKAASAGTVREFECHMKKIQAMDPEKQLAYNWLKKLDPALWAKSHFSTRSKCDILVNNLSESFNGYILEARDKPIISMVEWIRRKLMNRIQVKRKGMEKYAGPICPLIQEKLEKNKVEARNCFPSWSGDLKFEVDYYDTTHAVNLELRSCGCKMWDLTGIPCKHAVSAIYSNKETPEAYVHPYFSKEAYLNAYASMINPVPGQHDWVETNLDPILPPFVRKQPGRPKKLRRREADEPRNPYRVSKKFKQITCAKCGRAGHNSRTCKGTFRKGGKRPTNVGGSQPSSTANKDSQPSSNMNRASQGPKNVGGSQPLQPTSNMSIASIRSTTQRPKMQCVGGKGSARTVQTQPTEGKGPYRWVPPSGKQSARTVQPNACSVKGRSMVAAALKAQVGDKTKKGKGSQD